MIDNLKQELSIMLSKFGKRTGLYLSGGSDSLLLLYLLIDISTEFSIVCFDHSFTREQKKWLDKIIHEKNLKVFSYPPMNAYWMGDGKQLTLVEEYAMLDGVMMPFLRDAKHNEKICAVEDVKFGEFTKVAPIGFSLNICGLRKTDRHYATGRIAKAKFSRFNQSWWYNPLWDLTRQEVKQALSEMGKEMPKIDTGIINICRRCLDVGNKKVFCPKIKKMISPIEWSPTENLSLFRQKYGYEKISER